MNSVDHFNTLLHPDKGQAARKIHITDKKNFDSWLAAQPPRARSAAAAQKLKPLGYASAILPGEDAEDWSVVTVVSDAGKLSPWCLAKLAETLPEGAYRLATGAPGPAALGWLLAHYRFDRYLKDDKSVGARILLTADPASIDATVREAEAVALVRDMVNTPAADMGPPQLEAEAARLAKAFDATLTVTKRHDLETGYPMIHAVGMAAARDFAPRLIEIEWGNPAHPRLAIIGKGVCFDSGGLDIKPSSGMRLMKKDMGGAAHAFALAQLVMAARLPVRLHLLVPAVENAIAGNAFRPGDVLTSRQGLTVEIANTDAEGRLVLADALTKAGESDPTLIVDFATLTGAARVALGPDLPATFANDDELAAAVVAAGIATDDPLWRMPLHAGYDDMLKSDIADLNNSPDGGFAGAVTAALFLQRFVSDGTPWLHLDTFAWRPAAKPGRPKGGEALGLRAVWAMLQARFG
ncbi:M17 family metallopeptidase [Sphingomonas sp. SUN039]|uniref:leucyl aminopeptidase family protein n=1 Tax=Sphingomonas sp. SUN039 TaxID=2937787 RepID=UPI0021647E38|nr:leucyl aminopeptidase family protein [Sphingomonas sp. SUN039]UVO52942.1 leucyl aminopeptidase family protein [Sphingomonas sp. SUN039]